MILSTHPRMKPLLTACAALAVAASAHQASAVATNMLTNPSFEDDDTSGGDVFGPSGYGFFNDAFVTSSIPARTGNNVAKFFGPFFDSGGAGVTQIVAPASPGQVWRSSAFGRNDSSDPTGENNFAVVKLEFLDASNDVDVLSFAESTTQINANSPQDTWIELDAIAAAPAGTERVRFVIVHVQLDPVDGGSVFFDDASLTMLTLTPGDTDADGDIDDADLGTSFSNYTGPIGAAGGKTALDGDADGDGDVDDADLGTSFAGYTGPLGPAAVPEPASALLLGLGGLLAARRRRN